MISIQFRSVLFPLRPDACASSFLVGAALHLQPASASWRLRSFLETARSLRRVHFPRRVRSGWLSVAGAVKLSLRTIDIGTRLSIDLLLDGENFDLFVQKIVDASQSRGGVGNVQNGLCVFNFELEV